MIKFKVFPIKKMDLKKINSPFGMRTHPVYKTRVLHEGVDYPASTGVDVLAVADGVVLVSKMQGNGKGYGNYVVIRHNGFDTLAAHLSTRSVRNGQKVTAGQVIGKVGSTGDSTGPHLHFGLCKNFYMKDWFDPAPYLTQVGDDDEVVDNTKVVVNGKTVEVERILKNGTNYIRLRDFDDKLGICEVGYDEKKKLPTVNSKR